MPAVPPRATRSRTRVLHTKMPVGMLPLYGGCFRCAHLSDQVSRVQRGRGTTACVFSFPTEWRIVGDLGTKDYWEVAMRSRLTIVLSLILFAASGTSAVAQNYYQPPQIGQPNMQQLYAPQPEQPPQPLPPKESGISPPPIIPPGGTLSCRPVQVCEAYGYCYWQQVCQ